MGDHFIKDRSSNRLPEYDYSQPGAYFITVSTYHREPILGEICNGVLTPTAAGKIVEEEWHRSEQIRSEVKLDAFILMPNHLHGIIWITGVNPPVGAHGRAPLRRKPRSLGSFVAGFKSITTCRINIIRNSPGHPVWQRNYYDHIIRDDRDLNGLRQYIFENPRSWQHDRYYDEPDVSLPHLW